MNSQLTHHGILGQKWGVRRFQNKDGTYTKRGLERYQRNEEKYNQKKEEYETAKSNYKNGNGDYISVRKAKKSLDSAKRNTKESYKSLKKDKLADEGRELYKKGKTMRGNQFRLGAVTSATAVAAIATNTFWKSNSSLVTKHGNIPLNTLAATSIAAGGTAVAAILGAKYSRESKKLKAYYDRSYKGYM